METSDKIRELLTSHIVSLCRASIDFRQDVTVEGLLGITVDKTNVFLVNIKEVIRSASSQVEETVESSTLKLRTTLASPPVDSPPERRAKRKARPHKISNDDEGAKRFQPDINNTAILNPEAFEIDKFVIKEEVGVLNFADEDSSTADVMDNSSDMPHHSWLSDSNDLNDSNISSSDLPHNGLAAAAAAAVIGEIKTEMGDVASTSMDPGAISNAFQSDLSAEQLPGEKSTGSSGTRMKHMPLKRIIRKHNPELMAELVEKIRAGEITLADAARKYNIPRPTLSDKVRGRTPIEKKRQNRRVLDPEEEEELVVWCLEQASAGTVPTTAQFMERVNQYLANHGRNSLANCKEWLKSFVRRHTELVSSGITFSQ